MSREEMLQRLTNIHGSLTDIRNSLVYITRQAEALARAMKEPPPPLVVQESDDDDDLHPATGKPL